MDGISQLFESHELKSQKKIYDEVTEDIFDWSNVRILKEIEKKKMGDVYTLLCLRSAELNKAFALRNLSYSKISVVMLLGYRVAGISRKLGSEQKQYVLHTNAAYLNTHFIIASVTHALQ